MAHEQQKEAAAASCGCSNSSSSINSHQKMYVIKGCIAIADQIAVHCMCLCKQSVAAVLTHLDWNATSTLVFARVNLDPASALWLLFAQANMMFLAHLLAAAVVDMCRMVWLMAASYFECNTLHCVRSR